MTLYCILFYEKGDIRESNPGLDHPKIQYYHYTNIPVKQKNQNNSLISMIL